MIANSNPEPLVIKSASTANLETIQDIAGRAYSVYLPFMDCPPAPMVADFARHLAEDTVFVAEDAQAPGRILGYAILIKSENRWLLDNIAVDPEVQRRGVGSALIAHCEGVLRTRQAKAYEIYTNVIMTKNIEWYAAIGFVETGRRLEDGFSRVYFQKDLM